MKTIDERRRELEEKQSAEREELEREIALARDLLIPSTRVHVFTPEPWALYETGSLDEALSILEIYRPHVTDLICVKSGCAYVRPAALMDKRESGIEPVWDLPESWCLRVESGEGYGPRAELSCHVVLATNNQPYCIKVRVGRPAYEGSSILHDTVDPRWLPKIVEERNYRRHLVAVRKIPAALGQDHVISWSVEDGRVSGAYHITYYWGRWEDFVQGVQGVKERGSRC